MLGTRYRGRRKGVAVREGSIEEARREAKLTLAQVAGDKLSRTAIHLIEKGRTRPSLETLQQIARQTRKPIEFFLTPDSPPASAQVVFVGQSAPRPKLCGKQPGAHLDALAGGAFLFIAFADCRLDGSAPMAGGEDDQDIRHRTRRGFFSSLSDLAFGLPGDG